METPTKGGNVNIRKRPNEGAAEDSDDKDKRKRSDTPSESGNSDSRPESVLDDAEGMVDYGPSIDQKDSGGDEKTSAESSLGEAPMTNGGDLVVPQEKHGDISTAQSTEEMNLGKLQPLVNDLDARDNLLVVVGSNNTSNPSTSLGVDESSRGSSSGEKLSHKGETSEDFSLAKGPSVQIDNIKKEEGTTESTVNALCVVGANNGEEYKEVPFIKREPREEDEGREALTAAVSGMKSGSATASLDNGELSEEMKLKVADIKTEVGTKTRGHSSGSSGNSNPGEASVANHHTQPDNDDSSSASNFDSNKSTGTAAASTARPDSRSSGTTPVSITCRLPQDLMKYEAPEGRYAAHDNLKYLSDISQKYDPKGSAPQFGFDPIPGKYPEGAMKLTTSQSSAIPPASGAVPAPSNSTIGANTYVPDVKYAHEMKFVGPETKLEPGQHPPPGLIKPYADLPPPPTAGGPPVPPHLLSRGPYEVAAMMKLNEQMMKYHGMPLEAASKYMTDPYLKFGMQPEHLQSKSAFSADNLIKGGNSYDSGGSAPLPPTQSKYAEGPMDASSRSTPNQDSQSSNSNSQPGGVPTSASSGPLSLATSGGPAASNLGPPTSSGMHHGMPPASIGLIPGHPGLLTGSAVGFVPSTTIPSSAGAINLHRPHPAPRSDDHSPRPTAVSSPSGSGGTSRGESERRDLLGHRPMSPQPPQPIGSMLGHSSLVGHPSQLHLSAPGHPGMPGHSHHPHLGPPPPLSHSQLLAATAMAGGPNMPLPLLMGPSQPPHPGGDIGRRTPTSAPGYPPHSVASLSGQSASSSNQSPQQPSSHTGHTGLERSNSFNRASPHGNRPSSPTLMSRGSPLHGGISQSQHHGSQHDRASSLRQQSPHMTPPPPPSASTGVPPTSSASSFMPSPLSKGGYPGRHPGASPPPPPTSSAGTAHLRPGASPPVIRHPQMPLALPMGLTSPMGVHPSQSPYPPHLMHPMFYSFNSPYPYHPYAGYAAAAYMKPPGAPPGNGMHAGSPLDVPPGAGHPGMPPGVMMPMHLAAGSAAARLEEENKERAAQAAAAHANRASGGSSSAVGGSERDRDRDKSGGSGSNKPPTPKTPQQSPAPGQPPSTSGPIGIPPTTSPYPSMHGYPSPLGGPPPPHSGYPDSPLSSKAGAPPSATSHMEALRAHAAHAANSHHLPPPPHGLPGGPQPGHHPMHPSAHHSLHHPMVVGGPPPTGGTGPPPGPGQLGHHHPAMHPPEPMHVEIEPDPEPESPSPTINRGPSPETKPDDTECHRSPSAIFVRKQDRGDYNSCTRTDLEFKPVPGSMLFRKREERDRKLAERERERRQQQQQQQQQAQQQQMQQQAQQAQVSPDVAKGDGAISEYLCFAGEAETGNEAI